MWTGAIADQPTSPASSGCTVPPEPQTLWLKFGELIQTSQKQVSRFSLLFDGDGNNW